MAEGGRIVVGIDGSSASKAGLRWALDEARLRGADVHLVHGWHFPAVAVSSYGAAALPVIAPEDLEKVAEEVLKDAVTEAASEAANVEVTASTVRGHPAQVLLAAAKGAALLVVGSRGLGGFAGMLLGSVSSQVIHHATCPVVVIRGDRS